MLCMKNAIMSLQMSQPTLRREGKARYKCVFEKKKMRGVTTNAYSGKMLEKQKRRRSTDFENKVRELFTHGEGISTPRARHKGRQPLIECAKHDFKIMYFPFLCLLLFWGRQGCCPCSYVSSGAMRNSDLRSSLSLKVYVLH